MIHILGREFCQWQVLDETLMVYSSYALRRLLIDGKHVMFGKVMDGYSLVKEMKKKEKAGSDVGSTSELVIIYDCGQLTGN